MLATPPTKKRTPVRNLPPRDHQLLAPDRLRIAEDRNTPPPERRIVVPASTLSLVCKPSPSRLQTRLPLALTHYLVLVTLYRTTPRCAEELPQEDAPNS